VNKFKNDDQLALNEALMTNGIHFDHKLEYETSQEIDSGIVPGKADRQELHVKFLDHSRFPRICNANTIHADTVVAHCKSQKNGHSKISELKKMGLYRLKKDWEQNPPHEDFKTFITSIAAAPEAPAEFERSPMAGQRDDGVKLMTKATESKLIPQNYSGSGFKTARLWNECKNKLKNYGPHYTDSVASMRHNFLYFDNVKAASTSIRGLLEKNLHVSWKISDIKGANHSGQMHRFSSKDFIDTAHMFKFSMVRDPVAKFESGVREAKAQMPRFKGMTADDILRDIIKRGFFTNEHMQTNSYRLSAYDASTPPSMHNLDFIGKVEEIENDWPMVVESMKDIAEDKKDQMNILETANRRTPDPDTMLSKASIQQMCTSDMFRFEWECFGYDLPTVCRQE